MRHYAAFPSISALVRIVLYPVALIVFLPPYLGPSGYYPAGAFFINTKNSNLSSLSRPGPAVLKL